MLVNIEQDVLLPWQMDLWAHFASRLNQLPHALLFYGQKGIGKNQFAKKLIHTLCCENKTACDHCRGCQLFSAGTHPDCFTLSPEGASQQIRIDAVRDAVEFVQTSPLIGQYKIILIYPANAMNAFSANALLKTVEEPPENTLFILICDDHIGMPATVVSRCQKFFFETPDRNKALGWLKAELPDQSEAHLSKALAAVAGAPLLAREVLNNGLFEKQTAFYADLSEIGLQQSDAVKLAEKWSSKDISATIPLRQCLDWLFVWLRAVLLFQLTKQPNELPIEKSQHFTQLSNKISREGLMDYVIYLQKTCSALNLSQSLNRQLVIEDLFIRWVQLCS